MVGSTQYFSAYGAVTGGYPLVRGTGPGPGESDPPEVLDLMKRIQIIPVVRRTLFGPRVTVFAKDGRVFSKEGTGREFIWDFEKHALRMAPIAVAAPAYDGVVAVCRGLDGVAEKAGAALVGATLG